MPYYLFKHKTTGETKEVFQKMNDKHEIGDDWERLFVNPQISFDTQISANDPKDFVRKTRDKSYSIGDLWSKSEELSKKREGNSGVDEVRVKAEKDYEKKTCKKHPHAKKPSKFLI